MELAELKRKLDKAKEDKARSEERLKNLEAQEKELVKELKDIGIDGVEGIAKAQKKLKAELESLFAELEGIEKGIEDAEGDTADEDEMLLAESDLDEELGDDDAEDILKELDL